MVKLLQAGGTLVTYGGLSKRPITVTVPTGRFIFSDLTFRGYWHSAWLVRNHREEENTTSNKTCSTMLQDVVNAVCDGSLVLGKRKVFDLCDVQDALEWNDGNGREEGDAIRRKAVFRCDED